MHATAVGDVDGVYLTAVCQSWVAVCYQSTPRTQSFTHQSCIQCCSALHFNN